MALSRSCSGWRFRAICSRSTAPRRAVPAIHDASTDLADPPAFVTLPLRKDNLESVPDEGRPGWKAIPPVERWRALHGEAYPDLKPVRLAMAPDAAIRKAEALARERGWDVASVDPQGGPSGSDRDDALLPLQGRRHRPGAAGRGRKHRRRPLGQPGRQERPWNERQEGAQIHARPRQGLSAGRLERVFRSTNS